MIFYLGSNILLNKGKGASMVVAIKKKARPLEFSKKMVTTEILRKIKLQCNLSMTGLERLRSELCKVDSNLFERGSITKIKQMTHTVDQFFSVVNISEMDIGSGKTADVPYVYCKNLPDFVAFLLNRNEISENFHLKFGMDSGGGSLKICLSLLSSEPESLAEPKMSGIKKLIILGLCPKITESYKNMSCLINIIDLSAVCGICNFSIAADFKMIMILLGLQSNSSTHPCPWCEAKNINLNQSGDLRSISSITAHYNNWAAQTGSDKSKAKYFANCVNVPLITGDYDEPILNFIPPPELHLLMGTVQHLFDNLKREHTEIAEQWIKDAGVQVDHYQRFNGNNARKLLKKSYLLENLSPGNKFISVFENFNKVVESCFGQVLHQNYKELIHEFAKLVSICNIRFTPKLHTIVFHVPQFCESTGRSLGFFSEQASEQVHCAFNKHSLKYHVNFNAKDCNKKLLRSLSVFNSDHL